MWTFFTLPDHCQVVTFFGVFLKWNQNRDDFINDICYKLNIIGRLEIQLLSPCADGITHA